jgi:hypothetical protein
MFLDAFSSLRITIDPVGNIEFDRVLLGIKRRKKEILLSNVTKVVKSSFGDEPVSYEIEIFYIDGEILKRVSFTDGDIDGIDDIAKKISELANVKLEDTTKKPLFFNPRK